MLEKSFGLFFFLKQPKNQKSDERYVYLRITVDGIAKEISTKRMWYSSRWDQSAGKAKGTKEDALNLNAFLDAFRNNVFNIKSKLLSAEKNFTAEILKNALTGKDEVKHTVLQALREHNSQMEALVGNGYSEGTLERFETVYKHVQAFIEWKYQAEDLELKELNYDFAADFAFWLKAVRKCNHNSTMKYVANFKKIVLKCISKGWLTADPFAGFKTTQKPVNRVALSKAEINTLTTKDLHTDRLNNIRDIFLFSCYTGLAYIDVKNLKRSQISIGDDGELWINSKRQKTESPIRLPLLPEAVRIMDQYKDHPKCRQANSVLPVLTNQKMNAYLKEIADLCGITKKITFHIARHTFATTITLGNGVPIETVSKLLSHNSIRQTQHYAKVLDMKTSSDMAALKQKLSQAV
ncbi:MAG: site-specific integrase [Bacteroidetes bacterium]|nr:site-specific integrase [Bacteroidota bacterium]